MDRKSSRRRTACRRLTEYLDVALNRVAVDREVFSRTDRLSRMANVVDSWLEAAGMRKTLARAVNAVATGSQSADSAMAEIVEPGYAAAVAAARRKLERNMAIAERAAIATAIMDTSGEPFRAMRDDLRQRTVDLENRARAKAMMDAVLTEAARHRHLDPEQRRIADQFIRGIAENERGVGVERAPDRSIGSSDPLVPARYLPDLAESEIADRLQGSSRLAGKRAEIEDLSRLVYGNSQAISASVANITDARSGAVAGDDVRTGRLGDMAGQGRTWLRGPSPERQAAEANAPRLAAALAHYGLAVDFERYQIVTQHREEQARQRVEIPRPSSGLSEVLRADSQEQRGRLASDPPLRRVLESLTLAITKRLSPVEKIDLKDGNTARLASSLGISPEQATALRGVYERARVVQERAMRQNHDLSRTNQLDIQR